MSELAAETGTVRKKWTGKLPVALLYPNSYQVAVANLGFQLIYSLLNREDGVVCERFVYPRDGSALRSLESSRPLHDFPLVFGSVSFESDYPALAAMLQAGGVAPLREQREEAVSAGSPFVVFGGAAMLVNPEPLADFADLMVIGEAEPVLQPLLKILAEGPGASRRELALEAARSIGGCYAPGWYREWYDDQGKLAGRDALGGAPLRVRSVHAPAASPAACSVLHAPGAELNMHMVELGRGCSRGCRFCAAGFIYRPPRLWTGAAVLDALAQRPEHQSRVGLLGMEMADSDTLERIAAYLERHGCALSFSSLRADRISEQLLSLLASSKLKSVAIAPDGSSQRLRAVINKGLDEEQLLDAASRLVARGIVNLKLYVMIGLPTETMDDLDEFISLVVRIRKRILPIGQRRGRMPELTLSVNSFVPKPWTPFQYVGYGGQMPEARSVSAGAMHAVRSLKEKIKHLRQGLAGLANLRIRTDHPERVLQQAVFSRGDRRLGPVLLDMGLGRLSFKQAMRHHALSSWEYGVRPRDKDERFCWESIDHGIRPGYLWREFERARSGEPTPACDTSICRRCGICNEV